MAENTNKLDVTANFQDGILVEHLRSGPSTHITLGLHVASYTDMRPAVIVSSDEMTCTYHSGKLVDDIEAAAEFADALGNAVWYSPEMVYTAIANGYSFIYDKTLYVYRMVRGGSCE